MADFLELEIVKYRENENGEIVGIEWENVCINVDNISHYKKINNTLRRTTDIKENALLFIMIRENQPHWMLRYQNHRMATHF